MSEEYKITTGTINGASIKRVDIEPSIIVDGKNYTASEFNKAVEMLKQPQLNENQQVVLDWLKANVDQDDASPMCSIFLLGSLWESRKFNIQEDIAIDNAYSELSYKQQAQVLEVFSRWALEQEEE